MDDLKKEIEQLRERIEVLERMVKPHVWLGPREIKPPNYDDIGTCFTGYEITS